MKMIKNQNGQALIELIVFLPLMFTVYAVITGFANAINGSINQQKVTRSYFYYRLQNNSNIIKPDAAGTYKNYTQFGNFFLGWKEYFIDEVPVAPCYKVSIPLKSAPKDTCPEPYTEENTLNMRVQTVYGICGATYAYQQGEVYNIPDVKTASYTALVDQTSCLIK